MLSWLLLCAPLIQAQSDAWLTAQEPPFDRISVEQGLSNQGVYALLQDRQGYIWLGTQSGLNRFDGQRFVHFDRAPDDPNSLSDNFIHCLLEDQKGQIWIGHRQGVSRLDKATEKIENFPIIISAQKTVSQVASIAELPDGNLLLGTLSGLVHFEVSKRAFTPIFPKDKGASSTPLRVNALVRDEEGVFWGGTDAGLLRLDANDLANKRASFVHPSPPIRSICLEGKLGLWLATDAGLYFFDTKTGQARLVGEVKQTAFAMKDSKGRLLVGSLQGIERWDAKRNAFLPFLSDDTKGGWLKASRHQALLEDRNQTYWIGTFSDGLYHFDPLRQRFKTFRHEEGKPHALSGNNSIAFLENNQGTLWIGTDANLNRFDPATGHFSPFSAKPTGMVRSVFEDRDGVFWAGIPTGIIRQEKGRPPAYLTYDPGKAQLNCPGKAVKAIFQDHAGVLWFGGGNGVFRQEAGSAVFEPIELPNLRADTNMVYHITEDQQHNLWISMSNGLMRLDKNRRDFRLFTHDPARPESLCDNNISSVAVGRDGQIWVASYDVGFEKYDAATETFRHFNRKNGLPDEKIWGIVEDNKGFLWLSHCRGLSCFDPRTEVFRHFDKADGLQDHEFTMGAFHRGRHSGKLYFGGPKGFNVFHPDSLQYNETPPPVVFSAFRYHRGGVRDSDFEQIRGISILSGINLDYPVQTIVCEFAALDFRQPEKNRYAYRIDGIHGDWVDLGHKSEVTFANLRPGTYTLRVRAANNDGVWNETGASLRITLLPPWWATWWAYAFYTLAVCAAFWAFYQNRLRLRLREQERLRLKELDEFKSRFFTNITHEFRTPLTVILGMAERLTVDGGGEAVDGGRLTVDGGGEVVDGGRLTVDGGGEAVDGGRLTVDGGGEAVDGGRLTVDGGGETVGGGGMSKQDVRSSLNLIKRNGQNLLRLVNQLLDLAKLESKTLKMSYVQGDVLPYLRYIAESLHSFANAQNVLLRVESEEQQIVMDYDPERLLQIVHNLLSNALKFTPGGGEVVVRLTVDGGRPSRQPSTVHRLPSTVKITVSDTGTGIPPEDLPFVFDRFFQAQNQPLRVEGTGTGIGLALTKELVQLLGGQIKVESPVPGTTKGTRFTVELPIRQEAEQRAEWTAVPTPNTAAKPTRQQRMLKGQPDTGLPRLLLIEDNPDVVEYLAACLSVDYQLDFAYNGREGIEKALETIPDIILSDVMMPEKDGLEVVETLKNNELTNHVPIVLLTAKASVEHRITGLRRGADAYLSKPFHEEELAVVLENLLETRQKLQAKYNALPVTISTAQNDTSASAAVVLDEELLAALPLVPLDLEDVFLKKVIHQIEKHLGDAEFNVPELSLALGVSQSQLYRKIKALTNLSTVAFIRKVRLQRGRILLREGQLSITEVAYQVGFTSPNYFSDAFFEEFGVRPSSFS